MSLPLERRFERDIGQLIGSARRACLRLLPWAIAEHDSIVQETLKRTLHNVRAGKLDRADIDLGAYVYGIARNCVLEAKRQLYLRELRACSLPSDSELVKSLFSDGLEHDDCSLVDATRSRLLAVLRYYLVHTFANATDKQRHRAIRDTFILARHYLREIPLAQVADELGLTRRACQYALDRTNQTLRRLFDSETGEARSFVENSRDFDNISELSEFLRDAVVH